MPVEGRYTCDWRCGWTHGNYSQAAGAQFTTCSGIVSEGRLLLTGPVVSISVVSEEGGQVGKDRERS